MRTWDLEGTGVIDSHFHGQLGGTEEENCDPG